MVRFTLSLIVAVVSFSASAQVGSASAEARRIMPRELTLSDAVMQKYRKFRPEGLYSFQWIPNSSDYTYMSSDYQSLLTSSAKGKTVDTICTVESVNASLNAKLYHLNTTLWKKKHEFWVNDGSNYYCLDSRTCKGRRIRSLKEGAENAKFHTATENVAYTIENNVYISGANQQSIAVTKHKDNNVVAGAAFARQEFGITEGLFWSNDGSKLAFYEKDESNVGEYPIVDISETPAVVRMIKYPMAGQGSEIASVGIYDLEAQATVYFKAQNGQENYLTNLAWTPDNKYVVIAEVNRGQDHVWVNVFDAESGRFVKTLFEETSTTWTEPEHPAFFPLEESNNFVWISERDGFNNLYYYDFDGNLIRQLTDHKYVVKDIMEFKNNQVYYTTTGQDPTQTHVFSVSLNGKRKILTRATGTHQVHISDNGKYFHNQFSSHTIASNDWILDGRGKIVSKKIEAYDKLRSYGLGRTEIGSIAAQDGTKLITRMIKPSNFDPNKKYPVLIYVYGGPHAQLITDSWTSGASLWMHWMAQQGYIVFTVDNRGSANRGVAFESQIHRQLGRVEMEDQMSGVAYLKSLPYVDSDRLAVHGWSFGGFMTCSLLLQQAGTFQVGVAGGPVTDWKYYEVMYGERYMDQPSENKEGYEQTSLMTHAENLKDDLLLIHGTSDPTVVMQHNHVLVKKFVDLGLQVDFFPYPMHEHNVRGKDRVHLMEKVLSYILEKNI